MPTDKCGGNDGFGKNYHLATTAVITDSGKNHQWMIKLMDDTVMRNKIFTES